MKKLFSAIFFVTAFASTVLAQEKTKKTLEGNGNLVTRDIPIQSFNELKASGIYELKLSQGNKESVKIEADENLQELFIVRNDGARLIIETKKMEDNVNIKSKNKMRVYVTFKNLKDLELSTIGTVQSDEQLSFNDLQFKNKGVGSVNLSLTANRLHLENKSVGEVTLTGKAENTVLKNNGVGSINAGNFVVQAMDIDNSGIGNVEVNAAKQLKVKDNWLGKVNNKGAAPVRKSNKVVI
ncbi:MAG: head GIN domain-containing protein [Chitinophagaceae bacterium]